MHTKDSPEAPNIEAAVGVFDSPELAAKAAAAMKNSGFAIQRVSKKQSSGESAIPAIVYEDIDHIDDIDVLSGMWKGSAIGVGSGLLLFAVPGLNVAAPIAGALAGAFIGGVAAVDETNRAIELPDPVDYQQLLDEGKSILIVPGGEDKRMECASIMKELGAPHTYQHPPVRHAVRPSGAYQD